MLMLIHKQFRLFGKGKERAHVPPANTPSPETAWSIEQFVANIQTKYMMHLHTFAYVCIVCVTRKAIRQRYQCN